MGPVGGGVGRPPNVCTKRMSFHTPSGTLTIQVARKVIELAKTSWDLSMNVLVRLFMLLAVVYVTA